MGVSTQANAITFFFFLLLVLRDSVAKRRQDGGRPGHEDSFTTFILVTHFLRSHFLAP